MSQQGSPSVENGAEAVLQARIKELETALFRAEATKDVAFEMNTKIRAHFQAVEKQNQELKARIYTLEYPEELRSSGLGWLSRIVLLLKRVKRPMLARELVEELVEMDSEEQRLRDILEPAQYFSVVLSKAIKAARLKRFNVLGTRGGYYALPGWVGSDGNLIEEMREQMV